MMSDQVKTGIEVGIGRSKSIDFTTARTHYFNRLNSIERLSTGSGNIDDILCGGIETKAVTEFYGAPSSGKTQLCHTICAIVPQEKIKGGINGKSIFIDTEGTFRPQRLESIARARGFDPHITLDNVMIVEAQDSGQQELIADNIDSLLKNKDSERFKLLVVDSPVTHYRSEYIERQMLSIRQQKLYKFMRRLVSIAHAYNIAVVITNHINTTPDSGEMFGDRPIGGNAMSHAVTYSVRLWTRNGFIYNAAILSSPYHPRNSTTFYISETGVNDD